MDFGVLDIALDIADRREELRLLCDHTEVVKSDVTSSLHVEVAPDKVDVGRLETNAQFLQSVDEVSLINFAFTFPVKEAETSIRASVPLLNLCPN